MLGLQFTKGVCARCDGCMFSASKSFDGSCMFARSVQGWQDNETNEILLLPAAMSLPLISHHHRCYHVACAHYRQHVNETARLSWDVMSAARNRNVARSKICPRSRPLALLNLTFPFSYSFPPQPMMIARSRARRVGSFPNLDVVPCLLVVVVAEVLRCRHSMRRRMCCR